MAKHIDIKPYDESCREKWDDFVMNKSANGTFLQTRSFLGYHKPGTFDDSSLMFMNGNEIIAVIPAHSKTDDSGKNFLSHEGSTFGGIVIGRNSCIISYVDLVVNAFNDYLTDNRYDHVMLRQTGDLYCKSNCELLDYYLYINGFTETKELGYCISYAGYAEDTISNFSSSRRRDYRYSLKNSFTFRELETAEDIRAFHDVLCDNYRKFNKSPIHTYENLCDFKFNRLQNEVRFFGVFEGDELIAGCMAFCFFGKVFHTQYLAVRQDRKDCFANEFLYKELIDRAKSDGYPFFSLGTSVSEDGRGLNTHLAQFKEGFGTSCYINRSFVRDLKNGQ